MKRSWMYPVLLSRNRELTLISAPRTAMQYGVGCDLMSERPRGTLAVSAQAPAPRQTISQEHGKNSHLEPQYLVKSS
jgi:hypothetical protein